MSNTENLITIALTGQQARLVAAALSLWGAELDHRAETARTTEQDRWEAAQLAAWDAGADSPGWEPHQTWDDSERLRSLAIEAHELAAAVADDAGTTATTTTSSTSNTSSTSKQKEEPMTTATTASRTSTRVLTTSQQVLIMAALDDLRTTTSHSLELLQADGTQAGQDTLTAEITDIETLYELIADAPGILIEGNESARAATGAAPARGPLG